jgi:hypothetical protein
MQELVHSILHSKLLSGLRRPSFAGNGLPERMRSISFALLGLTAAAGLALVAIFAQLGFPLLSPAPLPDEPSATESIARAERLPLGHAAVAVLPARPAPAQRVRADSVIETPAEGTSGPAGGGGESQVAPAEVDVPAPVDTPGPSAANNGGGAGNETGGGSAPAPTATPIQPAASPSKPASSPQPPSPKPEAITSAPKPEPAPGPGNSSSAAAAEHASERGIEASASSGPPESTPANVASAAPEPSAAPGNGNGLAKGHYK